MITFLKGIINFFREGRKGEERDTSMFERNINQLPVTRPQLGTWPATQACGQTGN